jgi:hypothetical protein
VFLDGDCIPRPNFIASQRRFAEKGWFVVGNRTLLSRELTERVLSAGLEPELWTLGEFFSLRLKRDINRLAPLLPLRLGPGRKLMSRGWKGARSCNLGIWRSDLEAVDGFDCRFSGWGLEDSDIIIRLLRAGVSRKDGRFATGVLHLWHRFADRSRISANESLLESVIGSKRVLAIEGLSAIRRKIDRVDAEDRSLMTALAAS